MKNVLRALVIVVSMVWLACGEPKPATSTPGDTTHILIDTAIQGDSMKHH